MNSCGACKDPVPRIKGMARNRVVGVPPALRADLEE